MKIPNQIDSFSGEYRFLSNFWPCRVEFEGQIYPSVEHAYVAAKTTNPLIRELITVIKTAGKAKRVGKAMSLRSDWEDVKENIMYELVKCKFSRDLELKEKLLATGDAQLIEGNTWGDTFWGVCSGFGDNKLGKILMKVREELEE